QKKKKNQLQCRVREGRDDVANESHQYPCVPSISLATPRLRSTALLMLLSCRMQCLRNGRFVCSKQNYKSDVCRGTINVALGPRYGTCQKQKGRSCCIGWR